MKLLCVDTLFRSHTDHIASCAVHWPGGAVRDGRTEFWQRSSYVRREGRWELMIRDSF